MLDRCTKFFPYNMAVMQTNTKWSYNYQEIFCHFYTNFLNIFDTDKFWDTVSLCIIF